MIGVPKRPTSELMPADWRVVPLGSLLQRPPAYGVNAPAVPFDMGLPPYVRITDIDEAGRFTGRGLASISHPLSGDYVLERGDLVIARTGASVGKSYAYREEDGRLVFAGFLIRITPAPNQLLPGYLSHFLKSRPFWSWVRATSMRSGQPGVNGRELTTLRVIVPGTVEEQAAIAQCLDDADSFIESLEQLLAKKRLIKQGLKQQLLRGEVRLPGFRDTWKVTRLSELGVFLKGQGVRRDQSQTGSLPCVRYGELYTAHDDYVKAYFSWISPAVASTATPVRRGDILFAASGETKAEIGKCAAIADDVEAYAGGDILILRTNGVDPLFLGCLLNTPPVNRQKAARGQGDAIVHIKASALAEIEVSVPGLAEQSAIATILRVMDLELASLEVRLAKARQIKQGMMQNLLTGKIRLGSGGRLETETGG